MHRREEGGACVSTCIRLDTLHAPLPRPPEKERFPQRLPLPRTFGLGSHPTSRVPLPSLPAPPSTQVPPPRGSRLASPRLATAWALTSARAGRPLVGRGLAGTLRTSVCSLCALTARACGEPEFETPGSQQDPSHTGRHFQGPGPRTVPSAGPVLQLPDRELMPWRPSRVRTAPFHRTFSGLLSDSSLGASVLPGGLGRGDPFAPKCGAWGGHGVGCTWSPPSGGQGPQDGPGYCAQHGGGIQRRRVGAGRQVGSREGRCAQCASTGGRCPSPSPGPRWPCVRVISMPLDCVPPWEGSPV